MEKPGGIGVATITDRRIKMSDEKETQLATVLDVDWVVSEENEEHDEEHEPLDCETCSVRNECPLYLILWMLS